MNRILNSNVWCIPGEWFTKTKINRPFIPPFALTINWHWSLKEHTNHGHKSTEFIFYYNSLLKEKRATSDMNALPLQLKVDLSLCETLPGLQLW